MAKNKKLWAAILAAAAVLTSGILLARPQGDPHHGSWVRSSVQHCEDGLVCLDWVNLSGCAVLSCCSPASVEGSADIGDCLEFRHAVHTSC